MQSYHIHIQGQVQGVGFRPFVYQLAKQHQLCGWVNNAVDGVHIEINANSQEGLAFYQALIERAPRLARITAHHFEEIPFRPFDSFRIIRSEDTGPASLLLTPDFAICANCRRELLSPSDRRYGYPFITCTDCGPRYSIISELPYDRERTTMAPFVMCPPCREEYENPMDRRYYSQTNSCSRCGIHLSVYDDDGRRPALGDPELLDLISEAVLGGQIVAIKGIGGYLLMCDATNPEAIRTLRARKVRPTKPFAVMYPNVETIRSDARLRPSEAAELQSSVAPILLLPVRADASSGVERALLAPGLAQLGIMLPYTPLYELLIQRIERPVVATSGNISQSPIVYEDEKALADLSSLADLLLVNDRPIVVPQDDSVIRYSLFHEQRTVIRRSRGLAPTLILPDLVLPETTVLAMGAEKKGTFSLLHRRNTYVSQYLGDLDQYDTQQHFDHTLQHFLGLFEARPDAVLVDRHPNYYATRLGIQLADRWGVPVHYIQHHLAHFAAVLAESSLPEQEEPVLGVIWDGTGMGDDGQIWGGEFFEFRQGAFSRAGHFSYFPFMLGDKMPREPRMSALVLTHGLEGAESLVRKKFTSTEWKVYQRLLQKEPARQCSSVGRIFDAVASLLGLPDCISFEGEAAMQLEQRATRYFRREGLNSLEAYDIQAIYTKGKVQTPELMKAVLNDCINGKEPERIAARFHLTLACLVQAVARDREINKVCFSGGVWQNTILVDLIHDNLSKDFKLYFHKQLSPNDEGVSFGQLAHYLVDNQRGYKQNSGGAEMAGSKVIPIRSEPDES